MFINDGEKNNVRFHVGQEASESQLSTLFAIFPTPWLRNYPTSTVDKSLLAPVQCLIKNTAWTASHKNHYGCSHQHHSAKKPEQAS